ncbi:OmpA family protein [Nannocystis sp.]|uniref:OmpA family protein n=1 Tax=Nannocystis sp. TaxID=1962667 RepID=UPI0025F0DA59|nr:OmpA family protein [Nannocystis sp.]MBK7825970.1 OmpA family protein [Nannocystis sp.]
MLRAGPLAALAALTTLTLGACKVSGELKLGGSADTTSTATPSDTPAEPAPPQTAVHIVRRGDKLIYENGEIEFATNSDNLRGAGTEAVLDEFAGVLARFPGLAVRIEGHTDSRGSTASNKKLSDDRARAIQSALVRRGVASERLSTIGYGENKPTRPEPAFCRNHSEDTVPVDRLSECHTTWQHNRRAVFVVTAGADTLPSEGASVSHPTAAPTVDPPPSVATTTAKKHRPDWALRLFGGYSTLPQGGFHGGHLGVGLHASQRFGKRDRGYIGGGPRLHYRGLRHHETDGTDSNETTLAIHQFGPEGNLLIGGGSQRVVGLLSARLGLGLHAARGSVRVGTTTTDLTSNALAGWALGGLVVLAKLTPRWSLGGHAEVGALGSTGGGSLVLLAEIGLNVAWHFGRGRRDGI